MQEKIYLGVRNRSTGEYYVTACSLPAQIGRQSEVDNQVLLDWHDRRISRVHGRIERTSRGFVYSDSSKHGSRIGGLEIRDSRVALSNSFQIDIENYTISRVEMTPFIIVHTDERLIQLQQFEVLPGRGLGLVEATGGLHLADLNRWTEWGKRTIGRFEVTDELIVWVRSENAGTDATKNKGSIRQSRTLLASLDVIEVEGHRFEVLHPSEGRIVCGNNACHLLNPPPLAGNCRYCGRDLAGSGGFSRVL